MILARHLTVLWPVTGTALMLYVFTFTYYQRPSYVQARLHILRAWNVLEEKTCMWLTFPPGYEHWNYYESRISWLYNSDETICAIHYDVSLFQQKMENRKLPLTPRFGRIWNCAKNCIKLHGLSPRANYTDRATAACRRSDCQLLRIEGTTWSAWRIPTAVFSVL
jgi:hypothetical protein